LPNDAPGATISLMSEKPSLLMSAGQALSAALSGQLSSGSVPIVASAAPDHPSPSLSHAVLMAMKALSFVASGAEPTPLAPTSTLPERPSAWTAVPALGLDWTTSRLSTPEPDSGIPEPVSKAPALKSPSLSGGDSLESDSRLRTAALRGTRRRR